jgi:hypothetical protein
MATQISMAGGAPWGFRLAGGGTQPLVISRLTPGGKAALDGVCSNDHVVAINGQQVSGLQLGELMQLIKTTGDVLHLTLMNDAQVQAAEEAERQDQEIKNKLHESHEELLHHEPVPVIKSPMPVREEPVVVNAQVEVPKEPTPQPPTEEPVKESVVRDMPESVKEQMTKEEWYALPPYIRKQIRPPKPTPEFKPQVNWMHGKLRLGKPDEGEPIANVAGQKLRNAVMAGAGNIEIQAGPINGMITHAQYNTPLTMYSDTQIVSTLMSQAVASGAEIQDASFFANTGVKVDTGSKTYQRIHEQNQTHKSKQSKSFNILSTLLKHPYEPGTAVAV